MCNVPAADGALHAISAVCRRRCASVLHCEAFLQHLQPIADGIMGSLSARVIAVVSIMCSMVFCDMVFAVPCRVVLCCALVWCGVVTFCVVSCGVVW